jgi:hypothetical protein
MFMKVQTELIEREEGREGGREGGRGRREGKREIEEREAWTAAALLLLYCCFTAALLLLYCCCTAALLLNEDGFQALASSSSSQNASKISIISSASI